MPPPKAKANDPSGIYKMMNTINGKVYIGMSNHVFYRHSQHLRDLRAGRHVNQHLQNAFNQYGEASFSWEILELCPVDQLATKEQYWIQYYDSREIGYNLTDGGEGTYGRKMGTQQRQAMSMPVCCLNTMQYYASMADAERATGISDVAIARSCRKVAHFAGMFDDKPCVWRFQDEAQNMTSSEIQAALADADSNRHARKPPMAVVCLESGQNYRSASEAATAFGVTTTMITACCRGDAKTCRTKDGQRVSLMYYPEYQQLTSQELHNEIVRRHTAKKTRHHAVRLINTGKLFQSLADAARETGVLSSAISQCCNGVTQSAGKDAKGIKLRWEYAS